MEELTEKPLEGLSEPVDVDNASVHKTSFFLETNYRRFHGVWLHFQRARVKVCVVQLCAKYRQGSVTLSPNH